MYLSLQNHNFFNYYMAVTTVISNTKLIMSYNAIPVLNFLLLVCKRKIEEYSLLVLSTLVLKHQLPTYQIKLDKVL